MEIGKIIAIGLVWTIFAVLLKKENPQLAMLLAAVTGILIFGIICVPLGRLIGLLRETAETAGVGDGYFAVVLKVIGIAYLTQFGAQLCADAGEGTVAAKIELAGKIVKYLEENEGTAECFPYDEVEKLRGMFWL